jgi:hypothetical protein
VLESAGFRRERVIAGNDTRRGVLVDDIAYVRRRTRGSLVSGPLEQGA